MRNNTARANALAMTVFAYCVDFIERLKSGTAAKLFRGQRDIAKLCI